jgi:rhodanese-related sulfurtransferase
MVKVRAYKTVNGKTSYGAFSQAVIVYCHVGSRSAYCQRALKDLCFTKVSNLSYGIVGWRGETDRG